LTQEYRFKVFGRLVAIVESDDGWQAFDLGNEGKRRPAGWVVPDFIPAESLGQYLHDLFHENATPTNGGVVRIK
jgi:hypothetical protein